MQTDSIDAAHDDPKAFAMFCQRYKIGTRGALSIFRRLSDASAFCEALQALNPSLDRHLSLRFMRLVEAQMIIRDPLAFPAIGQSTAVKKVSKKEILKKAGHVAKQSARLRSDLLALLQLAGPVVVFHADIKDGERNGANTLIQGVRSAIEPLNRLTLAIDRMLPLLSRGRERAVQVPATPFEIFDRLLARLWLDSGKSVTTTEDGPFATFLKNAYSSFGHTIEVSRDRLSAAKSEVGSTAPTDIYSELKRAESIRRTNVFDRNYRGRPSRGTDIKGHAKGLLKGE